MRWTLTGATTEYTVTAADEWLELHSWGPIGVHDGPSPLAFHGKVQYLTPGDVAPVEYATDGQRPFLGADLVAGGVRWQVLDAADDDGLRVTFADALTGLRGTQCYRFAPGTDVIERWVELHNDGSGPLELGAVGSAAFCVPTPAGAHLGYLHGQWSQEFTWAEVELPRGRFEIGSAQGVTGHQFAPYLCVAGDGGAWGVQLAWSGSWQLSAEVDAVGTTRVRAGALRDVRLAPGETLTTPVAAGAYSGDGVDGLARVWHAYERGFARDRPRPVIYNSWEATTFDVTAAGQLALADVAADLGVETFVVDDGWFVGRVDDHGGLGDWTPDPAKFPDGFGAFVDAVKAKGLGFGLWVEPEMVNPASELYARHPDWVYRIDGRPQTRIRNQYLLDLGRADVFEFVTSTLEGLLARYPIDYLKWDFNRPRTEAPDPAADARHVRNLYRVLDRLRTRFPHVTVEGCAAGGARVDLATAARVDVLWPSDNTAPMDRLRVQHGFLAAHAPHLMSSWVTDAPGLFDARPRSLDFRFVLASAGVLGIGADVGRWSAAERDTAREWVARYKSVRDVITAGTVYRIGAPEETRCAVQYTLGPRTVVLAWNTGTLDGLGHLPGRDVRLPLRGLRGDARYRARGIEFSGTHLATAGLPVRWTAEHDAEMIVLEEL
ncbi:alpha-galactosidase [Cryptosporangium arvum]|uniref:alpha-galactosidase n=1 Tax=Cryptosporangium arvum TaxID=80871 RepID=UPI0004B22124|nr:alpha-galactosidase [Cryptosporangium arvum]